MSQRGSKLTVLIGIVGRSVSFNFEMARLGIDFPPKKRAEIGLTYIYGIGRARSMSILVRRA